LANPCREIGVGKFCSPLSDNLKRKQLQQEIRNEMTIDTQSNKVQYLGNGVASSFAVPFKVFAAAHLHLFFNRDGLETPVPPGTYLVNGLGADAVSVSFDQPPALGTSLTILRLLPLDQPTDLQNGGDFNADVLEYTYDYLEMQIQQLREELGRGLKASVTSERSAEEIMRDILDILSLEKILKEYAERAESAAALVELAKAARNAQHSWIAQQDIAEGEILTLPLPYYPAMNILLLQHEGTWCCPAHGYSPGSKWQ
jgi:hypothetical protein